MVVSRSQFIDSPKFLFFFTFIFFPNKPAAYKRSWFFEFFRRSGGGGQNHAQKNMEGNAVFNHWMFRHHLIFKERHGKMSLFSVNSPQINLLSMEFFDLTKLLLGISCPLIYFCNVFFFFFIVTTLCTSSVLR